MAREDPKGFEVDVNELEMIANTYLRQAADELRVPIAVIMEQEGLEGPGHLPAVDRMKEQYGNFTRFIGYRQKVGCERIDATIEALREIVELYRRVDGQR